MAVISVNQFGCESTSWNAIEIPNNVNICNILSGCFCDSSLMYGSTGLINLSGLQNPWNYSTVRGKDSGGGRGEN